MLVPIINGRGKDPGGLGRATQTLFEFLETRNCDVLTVVINRVDPREGESILAAVKKNLPNIPRVYVLPEEPFLEQPTVRDISRGLGAELISGDDTWLDGEVRTVKVAAMELPNFLDHLEEGSLVITPGDRSDIILGTLAAADRSTSYPRVAGMVLTGNLKPAPQIERLIEERRSSKVRVRSAPTRSRRQ
jgi:phosphate acetyltransferase